MVLISQFLTHLDNDLDPFAGGLLKYGMPVWSKSFVCFLLLALLMFRDVNTIIIVTQNFRNIVRFGNFGSTFIN